MQKHAYITGTGFYVPDTIITNIDLEKNTDTTDEWIRTRTGIVERHIVADGQATSDLATEAAMRALKNARVEISEIDAIIVATLSPDMLFPSTACLVQRNLGANNSFAFDIGAACSGFTYGLCIADALIKGGKCKTVLLIGAEIFSRILDWQDRNTYALFGDGSGAVVLKGTESDHGIIAHYLGADGNYADILNLPAGGARLPASHETINKRLHYLKMNGKEVYKIAVPKLVEAVEIAIRKAGLQIKDIDLFIPHQANVRIIESVAEKLDLPKEKVFINIEKYGNTSAASIPIALDEALKAGRIKENDIIVMASFGAGVTWGATVIRW